MGRADAEAGGQLAAAVVLRPWLHIPSLIPEEVSPILGL